MCYCWIIAEKNKEQDEAGYNTLYEANIFMGLVCFILTYPGVVDTSKMFVFISKDFSKFYVNHNSRNVRSS